MAKSSDKRVLWLFICIDSMKIIKKCFDRRKGNIQPGQYYLQPDGVLKPLPPGQSAPPGTQVVSVKSNVQQQKPQTQQKQVLTCNERCDVLY